MLVGDSMKKIRIILSVALIALISVAWVVQVQGIIKANKDFRDLVSQADQLCADKLYQQAIQSYEAAIKIKDNDTVREKWISAYEFAYEDGVVTKKEYTNALNEMCSNAKQKKNPLYWEKLISLSIANEEYTAAKKYLENAEKAGASSDTLAMQEKLVRYSFIVKNKTYSSFYRSPNGYIAVFDNKNWGILDPSGEWFFERSYAYASPVGSEKIVLLTNTRDSRIVNQNGIVEAILPVIVFESRAISDSIIPIKTETGWRYYNYVEKTYLSTDYEDASSFHNGRAVISQGGVWRFVNTSGEFDSESKFSDIKLYPNGEYSYNGVMTAKQNGKYGLYDASGVSLCDRAFLDLDLYYGEAIAFQDSSGKWGFINKNGETVIPAQYENAKSFSHGLAAICINEQWGFIDDEGTIVIPCEYSSADYFNSGGICFVSDIEGNYYLLKMRFAD